MAAMAVPPSAQATMRSSLSSLLPPLVAQGVHMPLQKAASFEQPPAPGSYVPAPGSYVPPPPGGTLPGVAPGSYQPPPQFATAMPCMQAPQTSLQGGAPNSYVPPPSAVQPMSGAGATTQGNNGSYVPIVSATPSYLPPSAAAAPGSFVPATVAQSPPSQPLNAAQDDQQPCGAGVEMTIGAYRFRCSSVLGRGSFSEVWAGDTLSGAGGASPEVALKDVTCKTHADLQQALFETGLLERLQNPEGSPRQDWSPPPPMRIPKYLAHRVDATPGGGGWRVRTAMTRVPGEPLDAFLRRGPPPGRDGPSAVRCGCALAQQLVRQLGPAIDRMSRFAFHRDVNSHNVLISDAIEGGKLRLSNDVEDMSRRASFWLIDFGLAVDATTWQTNWSTSDVAGDCRYWPPCSFLMSFYGAEETLAHKDFCSQYKTRLDIVGLGLTALELLCATAVASSDAWGAEGLRGSWRRLFDAWEKYREEVTRWHLQIFKVFAAGGDIVPLYHELAQERVVDKVTSHVARIRNLLRACTQRAEEPKVQRLLGVLAEMIDEKSTMSLRDAVETLGGEMGTKSAPSAAFRSAAPQPLMAHGMAASTAPVPATAAAVQPLPAPLATSRPQHGVSAPAPMVMTAPSGGVSRSSPMEGRASFTPMQPLAPPVPASNQLEAHHPSRLQWSAPLAPAGHTASNGGSASSPPQQQAPSVPHVFPVPHQQQNQHMEHQQHHAMVPQPQGGQQQQQQQSAQQRPPSSQMQHALQQPLFGAGVPGGTASARDGSAQRPKGSVAAPHAVGNPAVQNLPLPCHVRPRFAGA